MCLWLPLNYSKGKFFNNITFTYFSSIPEDSKKVDQGINDDLSVKNHNSILLKNAKCIYKNPYENRFNIYSDLKNKSFIYCWYNIITNDFYIGSTNSGKRRFQAYLSPGRIGNAVENPKNTHGINIRLARSIIKYGYNSFYILILEILDEDQLNKTINNLIDREQYYFDTYSPTYNILKMAGNSDKKMKLQSASHRNNISKSLKGRTLSEETRARIAAAKIGKLNPRWGVIPSEKERVGSRLRM
jgi:group I intron endonuclease